MKFGCFVKLAGISSRKCEGLVHISQLSREGRVNEVSDVVNRNQNAKVKVISYTGEKIGLSMKVWIICCWKKYVVVGILCLCYYHEL